MPLQSEIEYWDAQAQNLVIDKGLLRDNVYKRPAQLQRLLRYEWIKHKVLEIGHGNAMIAGALKVAVQGHFDYTGTELSPLFSQHAKAAFGLNSVQLDVRELHQLPARGEYTRIIAFDSLEHVQPGHRETGYHQIADMAAPGALLFIHYSDSVSYHDREFDHPFGLSDIVALQGVGFTLNSFERYRCAHPSGDLNHVFVVMQKCD